MDVPMAIVRVSATRMPQLLAEESLRAATEISLGTGSFEKATAEQIRRDWARQAFGDRQPRIVKPAPEDLAAIGIGVAQVDG